MRLKHSASKSLFPLVQIRPGSPVGCFLTVLLPFSCAYWAEVVAGKEEKDISSADSDW